jgi:N-dimethylarginine dimethylaminohydrolase
MQDMKRRARQLGINRWIVFTAFTEEPTRHADLHVRFLSKNLAAVAWSLTSEKDRQLADELINQLKQTLPGIRIIRVPMRSEGSRYASPLNWIQLGTELLVPRYELTQEDDIAQTTALLSNEGFNPTYIESPTLDTGGSLHCLTASIYLQA